MPPKRFVRKQDVGDGTDLRKEKYDNLIRTTFNTLKLESSRSEKKALLKNEYDSIVSADIEKDQSLLNRLTMLKDQIESEYNFKLIPYFVDVSSLFLEAKIIKQLDFNQLAFFQTNSLVDFQLQQQEILRKKEQICIIDKDEHTAKALKDLLGLELFNEQAKKNKEEALRRVEAIFKSVNFALFDSACRVKYEVYGSHVNQFSAPNSDIDITLITDLSYDERDLLHFFFKNMQNIIQRYDFHYEKLLKPYVRVPFVDITFKDIDVTISFTVNNRLAVVNSKMINIYSQIEPRYKYLGLLIKLWVNKQEIVSARKQYLSSYGYNLMVINFLQTVEPPILPSLQLLRANDQRALEDIITLAKSARKEDANVHYDVRIDFEDDLVKLREIMNQKYSKNKMTVTELLYRFFTFYGTKANFESKLLSVKQGTHLSRRFLNGDRDYLYSIEDPFDGFQNPGRYVKEGSSHALEILALMQKSSHMIKHKKILEIFDKMSWI